MNTLAWIQALFVAVGAIAGPTGTVVVTNMNDHTATIIDAATGTVENEREFRRQRCRFRLRSPENVGERRNGHQFVK